MKNYDIKLCDGMALRLLWIVVLCVINVVPGHKLLCAWYACVGRDVDTSMFLRTVAIPETLNG
jgi:hypothetical protein